MSTVTPKRKWERSDRIALWAFLVAFLSLASSITLPLVFRACDRAENLPEAEISGHYLHRLSLANNSNLIEKVIQSSNLPLSLKEAIGAEPWSSYLLTQMDHRLFRVKFTNKKNTPISISNLKFTDFEIMYPSNAQCQTFALASTFSADETSIDPCPVISVGPVDAGVKAPNIAGIGDST
ncbi:MAG: hypothetical protein WCK89_23170 [bacterium]